MGTEKDHLSQADRFREAARALECDDDDGALDRALQKLDVRRKPEVKPAMAVQPKNG